MARLFLLLATMPASASLILMLYILMAGRRARRQVFIPEAFPEEIRLLCAATMFRAMRLLQAHLMLFSALLRPAILSRSPRNCIYYEPAGSAPRGERTHYQA